MPSKAVLLIDLFDFGADNGHDAPWAKTLIVLWRRNDTNVADSFHEQNANKVFVFKMILMRQLKAFQWKLFDLENWMLI